MPEETFETSQPTQPVTEPKPTNWPKVLLVAIFGLGLLVGAAYAGYWYGTESAKVKNQSYNLKTQNQPSPTSGPLFETTPTPTPAPSITDHTANWNTYSSVKYNFSLRYPMGWEYLEVPTPTYQTEIDQLWISHSGFPPPQTDARADVVFIFTDADPSADWQPKYFNNYKSEDYKLGNVSAIKISGVNKEGLMEELCVIAKIGDTYIQVLPNQGTESLQYFDQILSTFRSLD